MIWGDIKYMNDFWVIMEAIIILEGIEVIQETLKGFKNKKLIYIKILINKKVNL